MVSVNPRPPVPSANVPLNVVNFIGKEEGNGVGLCALTFAGVRPASAVPCWSGIAVTQSICQTSTINVIGSNVMSLKGKVAIVTGGNSGIGLSIVLELAKQGANIVIDYVCHPEATEALEKEVTALGDRVIGIKADVSKVAELQSLIDTAVKNLGRLDIMVNNAGVETRTSVLDTTEEQYEKVLAINLKSAFFGTQLAAKQMIKQGGGGRIINITSVHEDWPMPGNTAYCLSKGGMRMLTRTAGVELAPHNILVVGVGPGAVATPINLSTMKDPALMNKLNSAIPLGRMAQPEEIGSVVAFLAGDGARYITATTIFADGGIMQSSPGL
jgi:glucose 1-dehydrogenase